jgi:K+-sensing histidine kinase KdpD
MEVFCDVSTETMEDIKELASIAGAEVASIISYCLDLGVSVAVISEISKRKQEKKERTKERKEQKKNIYTNNTSLKGGLGENSLASPKKKLQKKIMPVEWVVAADALELPPEPDKADLLRLAKNHNFEASAAKEFFIMFVNHHVSKGTQYKDWKRAWTTWILHQKKFNPEKAGKRSDSVVRSYETKNPLEGMFDDKA